MTHTITVETSNETYFKQIKDLAQKLGVAIIEKHEEGRGMSHSAQKFLDLQKEYPPKRISKDIDINPVICDSNL